MEFTHTFESCSLARDCEQVNSGFRELGIHEDDTHVRFIGKNVRGGSFQWELVQRKKASLAKITGFILHGGYALAVTRMPLQLQVLLSVADEKLFPFPGHSPRKGRLHLSGHL